MIILFTFMIKKIKLTLKLNKKSIKKLQLRLSLRINNNFPE